MPEDPADARLTGLLVPAPHVVPEKKAKKKATGTRKRSRFQVSSDLSSGDSEADSSHEGEEEKKEASPPARGGNKRKASPTREAKGSKKGRTLPLDCSANVGDGDEEWPSRAKPLARS